MKKTLIVIILILTGVLIFLNLPKAEEPASKPSSEYKKIDGKVYTVEVNNKNYYLVFKPENYDDVSLADQECSFFDESGAQSIYAVSNDLILEFLSGVDLGGIELEYEKEKLFVNGTEAKETSDFPFFEYGIGNPDIYSEESQMEAIHEAFGDDFVDESHQPGGIYE